MTLALVAIGGTAFSVVLDVVAIAFGAPDTSITGVFCGMAGMFTMLVIVGKASQ